MRPNGAVLIIPAWVLVALVVSVPASAQSRTKSDSDGKVDLSLSASPIYQFASDLDGGGDYRASRYFLRADASTEIGESLELGLGFSYDYEDYDFSGSTAFAGPDPWDQVHRVGFGAKLLYRIVKDWTLLIGPSLEFSRESGADWGDASTYGGVISATHRVNRNLTIGAGVGVFSGLEEVKAFPLIFVNWRISERLRLSNPLRVGPAGPAGLELVYKLGENWEIGGGAAYRSFRFRLDDQGVVPDGIGEVKFVPFWGRVSRKLGAHFTFDFYAGAFLAGELTIEDSNGNELGSADHDPAPFSALTVSGRF